MGLSFSLPVGGVTEPSAWTLIFGFAGVGFMAHRLSSQGAPRLV